MSRDDAYRLQHGCGKSYYVVETDEFNREAALWIDYSNTDTCRQQCEYFKTAGFSKHFIKVLQHLQKQKYAMVLFSPLGDDVNGLTKQDW